MTVVLRADSISKSFGDRSILTAATLRVVAGQIGLLVGRNGCGKSTLLRIATGCLTANAGCVTYRGQPMLRPRWYRLAQQGLFYVPDRELVSPYRTVEQALQSVERQFRTGGLGEAVEWCQLTDLLSRSCGVLSTGELRRVEIALALVRQPVCLIADEPYRHIDPQDRATLAKAFRFLADRGCAVMISGHEIEDLFATAHHVTWCTDGTTYELGTPTEAARHWRFTRDYLGPRAPWLASEFGAVEG